MINLLVLLRVFLIAQQRGEQVDQARVNAAGWVMHEELWLQLTDWLEGEQVVTRTQNGSFVLCRDPDTLELNRLLERMPVPPVTHEELPAALPAGEDWYPAFSEALAEADQARRARLQGSVRQWLLGDSLSAAVPAAVSAKKETT
jgi:membrane protein